MWNSCYGSEEGEELRLLHPILTPRFSQHCESQMENFVKEQDHDHDHDHESLTTCTLQFEDSNLYVKIKYVN